MSWAAPVTPPAGRRRREAIAPRNPSPARRKPVTPDGLKRRPAERAVVAAHGVPHRTQRLTAHSSRRHAQAPRGPPVTASPRPTGSRAINLPAGNATSNLGWYRAQRADNEKNAYARRRRRSDRRSREPHPPSRAREEGSLYARLPKVVMLPAAPAGRQAEPCDASSGVGSSPAGSLGSMPQQSDP